MTRRRNLFLLTLLLSLLLAACGNESKVGTRSVADMPVDDKPTVTVFRSPTCGCCGGWIDYLVANGYTVEEKHMADPVAVKKDHSVPPALYSCHTAVVNGYTIEGHVPVAEIERLLIERPNIAGIAVAGMPIGSPGMEVEGEANQPYDVIAFDVRGHTEIFASYEP